MPKLSLLEFAARKTVPGKTPPKRPDVNLQLARLLSIHKRDSQAKIEGVTKIRKRADITTKRQTAKAARRGQASTSNNPNAAGPSSSAPQPQPPQRTISERVANKQPTPEDPNELLDYHSFVGSGVGSLREFTGSEID